MKNGKLTRVNHHKHTTFFSNNRITNREENALVRTAVNEAITRKWGGSKNGGAKNILLQEISNRLIGSNVMNIPLTRIEVCGYIKQLEAGYLLELKSVTSNDIDSLRTKLTENEIKIGNLPKYSVVCDLRILQKNIKSDEEKVFSENNNSFSTPSIIEKYKSFYLDRISLLERIESNSSSIELNDKIYTNEKQKYANTNEKQKYAKLADKVNEWQKANDDSSTKALRLADEIVSGGINGYELKGKIQQFLEAAQRYKNKYLNFNFQRDIPEYSDNLLNNTDEIKRIASALNKSILLDFKNFMKFSPNDSKALTLADEIVSGDINGDELKDKIQQFLKVAQGYKNVNFQRDIPKYSDSLLSNTNEISEIAKDLKGAMLLDIKNQNQSKSSAQANNPESVVDDNLKEASNENIIFIEDKNSDQSNSTIEAEAHLKEIPEKDIIYIEDKNQNQPKPLAQANNPEPVVDDQFKEKFKEISKEDIPFIEEMDEFLAKEREGKEGEGISSFLLEYNDSNKPKHTEVKDICLRLQNSANLVTEMLKKAQNNLNEEDWTNLRNYCKDILDDKSALYEKLPSEIVNDKVALKKKDLKSLGIESIEEVTNSDKISNQDLYTTLKEKSIHILSGNPEKVSHGFTHIKDDETRKLLILSTAFEEMEKCARSENVELRNQITAKTNVEKIYDLAHNQYNVLTEDYSKFGLFRKVDTKYKTSINVQQATLGGNAEKDIADIAKVVSDIYERKFTIYENKFTNLEEKTSQSYNREYFEEAQVNTLFYAVLEKVRNSFMGQEIVEGYPVINFIVRAQLEHNDGTVEESRDFKHFCRRVQESVQNSVYKILTKSNINKIVKNKIAFELDDIVRQKYEALVQQIRKTIKDNKALSKELKSDFNGLVNITKGFIEKFVEDTVISAEKGNILEQSEKYQEHIGANAVNKNKIKIDVDDDNPPQVTNKFEMFKAKLFDKNGVYLNKLYNKLTSIIDVRGLESDTIFDQYGSSEKLKNFLEVNYFNEDDFDSCENAIKRFEEKFVFLRKIGLDYELIKDYVDLGVLLGTQGDAVAIVRDAVNNMADKVKDFIKQNVRLINANNALVEQNNALVEQNNALGINKANNTTIEANNTTIEANNATKKVNLKEASKLFEIINGLKNRIGQVSDLISNNFKGIEIKNKGIKGIKINVNAQEAQDNSKLGVEQNAKDIDDKFLAIMKSLQFYKGQSETVEDRNIKKVYEEHTKFAVNYIKENEYGTAITGTNAAEKYKEVYDETKVYNSLNVTRSLNIRENLQDFLVKQIYWLKNCSTTFGKQQFWDDILKLEYTEKNGDKEETKESNIETMLTQQLADFPEINTKYIWMDQNVWNNYVGNDTNFVLAQISNDLNPGNFFGQDQEWLDKLDYAKQSQIKLDDNKNIDATDRVNANNINNINNVNNIDNINNIYNINNVNNIDI